MGVSLNLILDEVNFIGIIVVDDNCIEVSGDSLGTGINLSGDETFEESGTLLCLDLILCDN